MTNSARARRRSLLAMCMCILLMEPLHMHACIHTDKDTYMAAARSLERVAGGGAWGRGRATAAPTNCYDSAKTATLQLQGRRTMQSKPPHAMVHIVASQSLSGATGAAPEPPLAATVTEQCWILPGHGGVGSLGSSCRSPCFVAGSHGSRCGSSCSVAQAERKRSGREPGLSLFPSLRLSYVKPLCGCRDTACARHRRLLAMCVCNLCCVWHPMAGTETHRTAARG